MSGDRGRRDAPWWSTDARRRGAHGAATPAEAPAAADASGDTLPGWAARNLADPSQDAALTPSAPVPAVRPDEYRPRSHRVGRGAVPHRTRGWGLALVSLAAAAAAVPLAVTTLAQQDQPLPRVGTFPVVSPGELSTGSPPPMASGPEAGVTTRTPEAVPEIPVAPAPPPVTVRPLAEARPTVPAPRPVTIVRVAPRPVPTAVRTTTPTTTPSTTTPTPRSGDDTGSGGGSRGGGSNGSGSNGSSSNGGGSNDTGSGGGSNGGLVGGVVGGVTGTVDGLLN